MVPRNRTGKARRRGRKNLSLALFVVSSTLLLAAIGAFLFLPKETQAVLNALRGANAVQSRVAENPVAISTEQVATPSHEANPHQTPDAQPKTRTDLDVDTRGQEHDGNHHDEPVLGQESTTEPLELGRVARYQNPQGVLVTEDGKRIEVGRIFERERSAVERRLHSAMQTGQLLRLNHDGTSQPSYLLSFRNATLHGPQASFYEDGQPTCLLDYRLGRRNSVLMTWDEQHRPFVFEQYEGGEKHGYRCLHKACSEECKDGHLWLVQKWRHGILESVHLVLEDGQTRTYLCNAGTIQDRVEQADEAAEDAELGLALQELEKFEGAIAANEQHIAAQLAQRQKDQIDRVMAMRRKAMELYVRNAVTVRRCSGGG